VLTPYLQYLHLRPNDLRANAAMNLGFGVGDFLAVIQLANKIRKDFAGAPNEFKGALDV
jgi:hypothetical protein